MSVRLCPEPFRWNFNGQVKSDTVGSNSDATIARTAKFGAEEPDPRHFEDVLQALLLAHSEVQRHQQNILINSINEAAPFPRSFALKS